MATISFSLYSHPQYRYSSIFDIQIYNPMQVNLAGREASSIVASFIHTSLNDFNQLTSALKGSSRSSSEINHHLKNRLLLSTQGEAKAIVRDILAHFLHVVQFKGTNHLVLSILIKVIAFLKVLDKTAASLQSDEETRQISNSIIDIIHLLKGKSKQTEFSLRIIQATYSLIDEKILRFANSTFLTKIYSICFECCESTPMVQNISVSALFALTEMIFANNSIKNSLPILTQMLEYLFSGKHFLWIKNRQLNSMIWDLVVVAVKSFPLHPLALLATHKTVLDLLLQMYKISMEKAFSLQNAEKPELLNKSMSKQQREKSLSFKKGTLVDFLRYYKTFIYFSIHLYLRGTEELRQIIPFRENLHRFKMLYEHERNSKLYLYLQGVSLLIIQHSYFLIEQEHGIILIDVFNKVSEELSRSHLTFEIGLEGGDYYLEKVCGDFNKITDNDYAKLIKSTILKLRKNIEACDRSVQDLLQESHSEKVIEESGKPSSLKKKWERMIKIIVKIIKHLTSLHLKEGSNEQIARKLISQLQYWFIICPTNKIRNLILEELLASSSMLDSKIQSIKASQCLQIGSNIIYGYYDILDSFGLAIIIRMIVGVRVSWLEGKGFDELEEVCVMTEKLYTEQQLVTSSESFTKTVQAFVQSINGLLADIEQPFKADSKNQKKNHKKHIDRYFHMIDQVLIKIRSVLEHNTYYLKGQWNFLTGFWVTMGSNKHLQVKKKLMNHLFPIITFVLKGNYIQQEEAICLYSQLGKLHSLQIAKQIASQLKHYLLGLTSQQAILELFKVLTVLLETRGIEEMHQEIYELLEMIIKETLFRVSSIQKLMQIIDFMSFMSKDKGEEYKIVNLLWSISDHLKTLAINQQLDQKLQLWKHLFKKFNLLADQTNSPESKQSCIHAFTQILAQSSSILGDNLFPKILEELYLQMFYTLMSFAKGSRIFRQPSEVPQATVLPINIDMIRIGIKNFIKISRKCLHISPETAKNIFVKVISKLLSQIDSPKSNKLQYLIEINVLLQFFAEVIQMQEYHLKDLHQEISKVMDSIQIIHPQIDKSTYTWKKYTPIYEELRLYFK